MAGESHREKLDRLNEAVTDHLLERVEGRQVDAEGNPVSLSNDDLRVIMQQLKGNSISVAAMPDSPVERMKLMLRGMQITPGHLEARQKALPHLLPVASDAASSATTAESAEW
jgi:hypothetical protein